MPSLFRKKSDEAAAAVTPAWHPNFRDYEKLPDLKVVRTSFFVNGGAIFVVLGLAVYVATGEVHIRSLDAQIAEEQAKIDRAKKGSDQAVAAFKKFQADEAVVQEVDAFVKSRPPVSVLIRRIGETLPPDVAVDALEFTADGLTLRLALRGDAVAASGRATAYLEQLKADKELSQFSEVIFAQAPERNPVSGRISVQFRLRYNKPPAGGKK
jgi:Tfp pilus assembly protein PilN